MCFFLSQDLINLDPDNNEINGAIKKAEEITERLLGCALIVRRKIYYISMIELYYGGIGDEAHDYFRYQNEIVNVQSQKGLKIYVSKKTNNDNMKHRRMDIVIGPQGVPISVLLRNVVCSETRKNLSNSKVGQPNQIIKSFNMGIKWEDHGKEIFYNQDIDNIDSSKEFLLIDTHEIFYKENYIQNSVKRLRVKGGQFNGINQNFKFYNREWNFSLPEMDIYKLPKLSIINNWD
ncbi:MAG: DNA-3-methyladenine glycosylase [Spirochaetes bacterium]|nr:DNA-3-methyladenine glycosylase [Spirochaetota bacterium]